MENGKQMESLVVSVVVATRNRPDALHRLVESVQAQDLAEIELIIVDDASEPPVVAPPGAHLMRNETGAGACLARNRGMRAASGEFIALFDDDCLLEDPTLLRRAVALARSDATIGAVSFREMRWVNGESRPHQIQAAPGNELVHAATFIAGMCLLRRSALEQVGGFVEVFGYYYEEIELSLRLLDAGYSIVYDPSLRVLHLEDARGRDVERIQRLLLRNALITIVLRYPWWYAFPAAAGQLVRFARSSAGAQRWRGVGEALRDVRALFPQLWRQRRSVHFSVFRRAKRFNRHPTPWPGRNGAAEAPDLRVQASEVDPEWGAHGASRATVLDR